MVIKQLSLSSRTVSSTCDSMFTNSRNCAAPISGLRFARCSGCSLCDCIFMNLPGCQPSLIHPTPHYYQSPTSIRPHYCHIPGSSLPTLPAPLEFWSPILCLSEGLFNSAKLFLFCPTIMCEVQAGPSIH